jgi:EmrB/QacA subfamily drug resistance transporter
MTLSSRDKSLAIWAALLALFLGALDSLIMSAAMPSIVAELGGLPLYAWVYSAYFLARAVSLPVFGKLADLYNSKTIFLFSIALFILSSIAAGLADSMAFLVIARVLQGVGAGGNFALVYIVLSKVSPPGKRAQTLSLGSTVWGVSSVVGPTLGGFIVTYLSWRWIFFINVPVGLLSLIGIVIFLRLPQETNQKAVSLDLTGFFMFSCSIIGLLVIFITGGSEIEWNSASMFLLIGVTLFFSVFFYFAEKKAEEPMIDLRFFNERNFCLGNAATFLASFSMFSFFAYAPLYIQGSLGLLPLQVGVAMVSLSLGWSLGAFSYGRISKTGKEKSWAISGGTILFAGSLLTVFFDLDTTMIECFSVFFFIGIGMGFVSLSTLILVQNCVSAEDLGIATSLHQFGRSLGGTIGVGICGGFVTSGLLKSLEISHTLLPEDMLTSLLQSVENLLLPGFQETMSQSAAETLRHAVLSGVFSVFVIASIASFLCLLCCILLSKPVNCSSSCNNH